LEPSSVNDVRTDNRPAVVSLSAIPLISAPQSPLRQLRRSGRSGRPWELGDDVARSVLEVHTRAGVGRHSDAEHLAPLRIAHHHTAISIGGEAATVTLHAGRAVDAHAGDATVGAHARQQAGMPFRIKRLSAAPRFLAIEEAAEVGAYAPLVVFERQPGVLAVHGQNGAFLAVGVHEHELADGESLRRGGRFGLGRGGFVRRPRGSRLHPLAANPPRKAANSIAIAHAHLRAIVKSSLVTDLRAVKRLA